MNIFSAPVLSLFSLRFYRQAARSPLTKGFAYLLYLSLLAALAFAVLFSVYGKPELREMTAWLEKNMPALTYSPQGLKMNAPSPQTLVHPKYGIGITFDMAKENVAPEEMGNAVIFVTSKRLYVRQRGNEMRVYSLERPKQAGREISVNEIFKRTFELFNRFIAVVIFISAIPAFFVWKLLAAFFYSLIALLINLLRKTKLAYSDLLNVCLFALTPVTLLQILKLAVPAFPLALGFWGSLFLTTIYLFLGIKLTEEKGISS